MAQDELLDMIKTEQSLPAAAVERLGTPISAAEILEAIQLLKDNKAPDALGAIAEQLKSR